MTAAAALRSGPRDAAAIDAFLRDHAFPIIEGPMVTFAYRGGADGVTFQHWVYGLESSQPFERVDGTDLWLLTVELPAVSRIEYKLGIHHGENCRWIRDPLNDKLARDPYGANSVCQTFGYETPDWAHHDPDALQGELMHLTVASGALGAARDVSLYLPPRFRRSRRYPLLVVHDGHDFVKFTRLPQLMDNLIGRLDIAPMILAMTSSPRRLVEYAGHEPHAEFVVNELLPMLEKRLPLSEGRRHRGLMGASFGAVASLATAWYHPDVFGRLLLLSGSFAFTDIGRHRRGPAFDPVVEFMGRFREAPGQPAQKVFCACGVYESLIYENRSLVPVLQGAGIEVRYQEARDGHNWINWRDRLRDGLSFLFPGPLWLVYE